MKNLFLTLPAALLVCLLAGCDDKNEGGETPTPPPADAKRISSITMSYNVEQPVTLAIAYDAEGRVSKMDGLTFTYADGSFKVAGTLKDGGSVTYDYAYTLSGSLAQTLKGSETEGGITDRYEATYTYDGTRLRTVTHTIYYMEDSDLPTGTLVNYTWEESSIASMSDEEEGVEIKFAPGKVKNDMNLDLFSLLFSFIQGDYDFAGICNLTGERSAFLPETVTETEEEPYVYTLTYTADKEGYITGVSVVSSDHAEDYAIALEYK